MSEPNWDRRHISGKRTLDRVMDEIQQQEEEACSDSCGKSVDGHCADHVLNAYRIKLLEDAKDALCKSAIDNHDAQLKNTTLIKWSSAALSLCAVLIVTATASGWVKLADFTDKIYDLREQDQRLLAEYKIASQDIHSTHAAILDNLSSEMLIQTQLNKDQQNALENIQHTLEKLHVE